MMKTQHIEIYGMQLKQHLGEIYSCKMSILKREGSWEFPGGLVVKILGFYCCGPGSIPGRRTKIPLQAAQCGQKKKKKISN